MTPEEQKCPVCERVKVTPPSYARMEQPGECWTNGPAHMRLACYRIGYDRLAERVRALEGERDAARREGWIAR
jgi:hypothetical protein